MPKNSPDLSKEALVVSLTLQKYIAGINKPYAHQLETQLTSIGQGIRPNQCKILILLITLPGSREVFVDTYRNMI